MVKKTSFLDRLFRRRTAVRKAAEAKVTGPESDPSVWVARPAGTIDKKGVETETAAKKKADDTVEDADNGKGRGQTPRGQKALSPREEATVALTDGFKDLSALLSGIHERMDEQSRRSGELNDKFTDLPTMARAQVEFMGKITEQMVAQKEKTGELLTRLTGLPELLEGIHRTLENHAAAEERTEKTLKDFRTTMNGIHQSIGTLSRESRKAVKEATESFERTQSRTTRVFEETQKQAHTTFERNQEKHLKQVSELMQKASRMNRSIVVLLVLVFGALVTLFWILLSNL